LRSTIGSGTVIEESVLMGADWFGPEEQGEEAAGLPPGIGRDCVIRRAIIDKNVRIGDGVRIENKDDLKEADLPCGIIRDGIVVIPRGTTVPAGTVV
jgi:glucose-1-phosphate adenylyltransferase